MYRIQLASGEEAAYRSLDEFAIAIQHEVVASDALIYHGKANAWLPIENHPHYELARSMAISMPVPDPGPAGREKGDEVPLPIRARPAAPESRPQPAEVPQAIPEREPAGPARPAQPAPGRVTTATVTMPSPRRAVAPPAETHEAPSGLSRGQRQPRPVAESHGPANGRERGYAIDGLKGLPLGPHRLVRKRSKRPLVMAVLVGTVAVLGRWSTLPKDPAPSVASAVTAGMETPPLPPHQPITEDALSGEPAGPLPAPESLTQKAPRETYRDAYRRAQAEFKESLNSLEFGNLFVDRRLVSIDSVRVAQRLAMSARNVVGVYRNLEVRIDQQFGRPASSLRESYGAAMMADSLLNAIDSIYGLLLANDGQYRLRSGRVRFEDGAAAARYGDLAAWLRSRTEWYRNRSEGMPLTIAPIVIAASAPPPPLASRRP